MEIYASTTFLGSTRTHLSEALSALRSLDLDGIELGSTHFWQSDLKELVTKLWNKEILTHNYFPPSKDNIILNIASNNPKIRNASIEHMKFCIQFAADIGAKIYTIHPGFLVEPQNTRENLKERSFDFSYSTNQTPYEIAFKLMKNALIELINVANEVNVFLAIETEGSMTSAGVALMESPSEYERLFNEIQDGLFLNLNLSHTILSAKANGFDVGSFINKFKGYVVAVELSDNDGYRDQHKPLSSDSKVVEWIPKLPDVPLILEFRCATQVDLAESIAILRNTEEFGVNK